MAQPYSHSGIIHGDRLTVEAASQLTGYNPQYLSAPDVQIVRHLSHGKTVREIATLLEVEEHKVNYTIRRLKDTLDAKTHAELVGNALRMRYVTLGDLE